MFHHWLQIFFYHSQYVKYIVHFSSIKFEFWKFGINHFSWKNNNTYLNPFMYNKTLITYKYIIQKDYHESTLKLSKDIIHVWLVYVFTSYPNLFIRFCKKLIIITKFVKKSSMYASFFIDLMFDNQCTFRYPKNIILHKKLWNFHTRIHLAKWSFVFATPLLEPYILLTILNYSMSNPIKGDTSWNNFNLFVCIFFNENCE